LRDGRVSETELLEQECIVTEQFGSFLRTGERREWVSLGITVVGL